MEENRGLVRRERLFHHLEGVTTYDIEDRLGREARGETIFQETLEHSEIHEGKYTSAVETFEKMESLETELFFLYEDLHQLNDLIEEHERLGEEYDYRKDYGEFFPYNNTELHIIAFVALAKGFLKDVPRMIQYKDCWEAAVANTKPYSSVEEAEQLKVPYWEVYGERFNHTIDALISSNQAHLNWFTGCTFLICQLFYKYRELYDINLDDQMRNLTVVQKYDLIRLFAEHRKSIDKLNVEVYNHFHNSPFHIKESPPNLGVSLGAKLYEYPVYKYPQQQYEIVDGIFQLVFNFEHELSFEKVQAGIKNIIHEKATELHYKSEKTMRQVVRYIKYGDRAAFSIYPRNKVHGNFVNQITPEVSFRTSTTTCMHNNCQTLYQFCS